jgi:hypothetical protein
MSRLAKSGRSRSGFRTHHFTDKVSQPTLVGSIDPDWALGDMTWERVAGLALTAIPSNTTMGTRLTSPPHFR